ncbi:MAG: hypothetical protein AAF438_00695 [Pseudomonadota bacterium]
MNQMWHNILKAKAINGWGLFWLVSLPMSLVMVLEMTKADMSSPPGVSHMIGFSVRWAVPLIYLVIAASSMRILFPGAFTNWWLRNRKHIGLCFAVAMAWQGAFIFLMSGFHREYYFEEIYYLRDELEGSTGYIFLAAMVVTSFHFGRKRISPKQWRLLHKSGVYFLWAYPFSVYWWNLHYYRDPQVIDFVFYWTGFAAFVIRPVAWGMQRYTANTRTGMGTPIWLRSVGGLFVIAGLLLSATGLQWQEPVTAWLTAPAWSANLELWLPFWPFEPFLSLFAIAMGVAFATWVPQNLSNQAAVATSSK